MDFDVSEIRPEVLYAAWGMEQKLRKNDHKINWDDHTQNYLIRRFMGEYDEFLHSPEDTEEEIGEIIDVMNFGMMLICRKDGIKCTRKNDENK